MKLLFLIICSFGMVLGSNLKAYVGFKVFRMKPESDEHNDLLLNLQREYPELDFWNDVNKIGIPVDVMLPPKLEDVTKKIVISNQIPFEVIHDNVQDLLNKEKVGTKSSSSMSWDKYYRLDDIYSWLYNLSSIHPTISIINGGSTYEKRNITGVKISFGPGKKAVFIEGGIHAREWIGPATVTYLINELLNSKDVKFRKIAKSFDWYLFPVYNPDGYEYTHTTDRFWRKNRKPTGKCTGTDLNRNWDYHWGEDGSGQISCSDTYGGSESFSEIETSTLSKYISTIGSNIKVFLAFHSYSQLFLLPYGNTDEHLDNYDDMLKIGKAGLNALASKYGTQYKIGNIVELLYKVSGGSMDWIKKTYNVPIALTYELRDQGKHGFALPENQIIPNCLEVMDSIVAMLEEGETLGYFTLG